jgi:hypothetical protein
MRFEVEKLIINKAGTSDWMQMKGELNGILVEVHHLSSCDLYLKMEDIKQNVPVVILP